MGTHDGQGMCSVICKEGHKNPAENRPFLPAAAAGGHPLPKHQDGDVYKRQAYNMEKPLEAAFPDGIQVVDGLSLIHI